MSYFRAIVKKKVYDGGEHFRRALKIRQLLLKVKYCALGDCDYDCDYDYDFIESAL